MPRAAAPEDEQERMAGDGGWQDDGQVDDGLDEALEAEPSPGQDEGERQPEHDRDDQADGRRDQAQPERVDDRRRADGYCQGPVDDGPDHEGQDRQPKEEREERGQQDDRPLTPATAPRPSPWRSGGGRAAVVLDACRALGHGAGRKPSSPRMAWPSGPANQSRNARALAP